MTRPAAKGKTLWPALMAAAALLLTAPQALASRTASARPGLLTSPAIEQPAAAEALVTAYAPRGFELRIEPDPRPRQLGLFPDLEPPPASFAAEKLASGVASWEPRPNLQRIQVVVAETWWVREHLGAVDSPNLYQAFGLDPQNNTDPLGLAEQTYEMKQQQGCVLHGRCPDWMRAPAAGENPCLASKGMAAYCGGMSGSLLAGFGIAVGGVLSMSGVGASVGLPILGASLLAGGAEAYGNYYEREADRYAAGLPADHWKSSALGVGDVFGPTRLYEGISSRDLGTGQPLSEHTAAARVMSGSSATAQMAIGAGLGVFAWQNRMFHGISSEGLEIFDGGLANRRNFEILRGANLDPPNNFPVIDRFDASSALGTSMKTIDLTSATAGGANTLRRAVTGYVEKLRSFEGNVGRFSSELGTYVSVPRLRARRLELGVQAGMLTPAQRRILRQAVATARSGENPVTISVFEVSATGRD